MPKDSNCEPYTLHEFITCNCCACFSKMTSSLICRLHNCYRTFEDFPTLACPLPFPKCEKGRVKWDRRGVIYPLPSKPKNLHTAYIAIKLLEPSSPPPRPASPLGNLSSPLKPLPDPSA